MLSEPAMNTMRKRPILKTLGNAPFESKDLDVFVDEECRKHGLQRNYFRGLPERMVRDLFHQFSKAGGLAARKFNAEILKALGS